MLEQQELIGTYIGGYQLTARLSTGSSSYTFLAETASLTDRQRVVIKWYYAVHLTTQQEKKDFLHQAGMLKRLQQPFILPILATGLFIDTPYVVTPYMSKGSLYDRVHRPADAAWLQAHATTIMQQIGQALAYSHQHDVIHGKIHPGNVLFNERDEVQLTDFQLVPVATASTPDPIKAGQPLEYHPRLATQDDDRQAVGSLAHQLLVGCASSTNQTPTILCDSPDNTPPTTDGEVHLPPISDAEETRIPEAILASPTALPTRAKTNRDPIKNALQSSNRQSAMQGGIIRRLVGDQGSLFLLAGILCIIIFSIIGTPFITMPHHIRLSQEPRVLWLAPTIVELPPTAQPTLSGLARTSRLIYEPTPLDLFPYPVTPAKVRHSHASIILPSPIGLANQSAALTVTPTYLNPQTCKISGIYYTCVVTLALTANSQQEQPWSSSSNTTVATVSPASGFVTRGDQVPITVQVALDCYGSGTITFTGNNTKTSLTWSC
jgi:hypothetical protein